MPFDRPRILGDDTDRNGERIFDPRPGQGHQPYQGAHILQWIPGQATKHALRHLNAHPTVRAAASTPRQRRALHMASFVDV